MKKLFTLIAIIAALSILTINVSAITLREDGNTVDLIADRSGDYEGIFILETTGTLELTRTQSPGGALVIHNPENNRIAIAGIGLETGDSVLRLTFEGEGTYSLIGESGSFEGTGVITGEIGEEVPDLIEPNEPNEPIEPNEPTEPNEPQRPVDENPKAGVALTSGAAIAAVAVAAIAISRRRRK